MNALSKTLCLIGIYLFSAGCSKEKTTVEDEDTTPPVSTTSLTVSQSQEQAMPRTDLTTSIVFSSSATATTGFQQLPAGYDDSIESFNLPQGHMAVFAENADGTGESICYVAATSAITRNLPERLKDKVSFVRCHPIPNVQKKGAAQTNVEVSTALGTDWFYNWGNGATSLTQQFVPMTWGKGAANPNNVVSLVNRANISHLLSFNEPDNDGQSNITSIDTAVKRYKIMMGTGLRLGSPATEQDNSTGANRWQTLFMAKAATEKARVDYIAIHWYDWGNHTQNGATDEATATGVFNRFKNHIAKVRNAYPNLPIWVTEYNANGNRPNANVHILFMQKSAAWMNSIDYIERYSYFFPGVLPPTSGTPNYTITPVGQAWKDIASVPSFAANIIPE
jgi:Glycosyl hydrolase catalytic core